MRYQSTRGQSPELSFDDVLIAGLASDGGLYLPTLWPQFAPSDLAAMGGLTYPELAVQVMKPFLAGSLVEDQFEALVAKAYGSFEHEAVVPLKQIESNHWLLELFHGPTLAFKDVALQLLGQLFDALLSARGQRITIIGATSGDTGSAAIEACRDREQVDIFILHPKGRTSEVQRRQMTTVPSANVHNIAIEGTFDDCQDLVKALFGDPAFRKEIQMSAVNSINWARVMAQIVYYFAAGVAIGAPHRKVSFCVPTGNFGNVFAGYAAKRMGLPVEQFLVASNRNDILARFFETGRMEILGVEPSLSPSMDIQVSSNFERLLFEVLERDAAAVSDTMNRFRQSGAYELPEPFWKTLRRDFDGFRLNDEGTLAEIAARMESCGELLDPHTAVGTAAVRAKQRDPSVPMVTLATAHPAKFPDAVEKATGQRPALPARLGDLFERPERYDTLANDEESLKDYVRQRARITTGA